MEKTIAIYYAVSRTGQGRVFSEKPARDDHFGIWCGHSYGCLSSVFCLFESEEGFLPPNITWSDEPVAMQITLKY